MYNLFAHPSARIYWVRKCHVFAWTMRAHLSSSMNDSHFSASWEFSWEFHRITTEMRIVEWHFPKILRKTSRNSSSSSNHTVARSSSRSKWVRSVTRPIKLHAIFKFANISMAKNTRNECRSVNFVLCDANICQILVCVLSCVPNTNAAMPCMYLRQCDTHAHMRAPEHNSISIDTNKQMSSETRN